MKLRNKNTGEVFEVLISAYGINGDVAVSVMDSNAESGYTDLGRYKTLSELNTDWEDYDEVAEKETIVLLRQLEEVLNKINANISKLCGKEE